MKDFLMQSDRHSNVIGFFGLMFLLIGFFMQVNEILQKLSILSSGIGIILIVYFLAIIIFGYESYLYESDISGVEKFVNRIKLVQVSCLV